MPTSILEMTVQEFMTSDSQIKSVQKSDTLEKVVPLLINAKIHHVAVFDGKEFAGFFGFKQLARLNRRPMSQTRVGDHAIKPPAFPSSAGIVDAAESMYRLNYKILPITEGKKLIGVLSERDIIRAAIAAEELNNKRIDEFMTPAPITVRETDRLGAAISILRDKNISRLPVTGKSGEVVGVFDSVDVLREMYTNESSYRAYKTSSVSSQKGSVTANAHMDDQIPAYKIAIKALMEERPVLAASGDSAGTAFRELEERGMTSIIVADGKSRPIGIVAPKDIIQYLARFRQKEVIYIQISGLESEDLPEFQKEEVHRMIDEAVRKLAKTVKMQFFTMHFKSYYTEAKKVKYSIRCKADTDLGLYATREYGWDIIDATSRALGTFEDLLISKMQKVRTKIRERNAHKKHAMNESVGE